MTDTTTERGRAIPPPPQHTLPDSGYTVGIRKIAHYTRDQVMREAYKATPNKPEPPIQQIEVAGELTNEVNERDPEYLRLLGLWQGRATNTFAKLWMRLLAIRGVDAPIDPDVLAAFKADMALIGVDLDADNDDEYQYWRGRGQSEAGARAMVDQQIWVWQVVCVSPSDIESLQNVILSRAQPTVEAVAAHKATFRSPLPGA